MNIARLLTVIFACNMTILTTYATTGFDENKPVGWAMVEGQVTGSDDENPITVTTTEELAAAMKTSEKNTILQQAAFHQRCSRQDHLRIARKCLKQSHSL